MQNDFNFCPNCGGKNIQNVNMRKWKCDDCGFTLYNNVAAAVGLVIQKKNGKVLFEKRAKEPRKGFLCLPGGFVDPDESAEDAVVRECHEELDAEVHGSKFLCSFPNTYEYKNIEYKTCDIFFKTKLPAKYENMEAFVKTLHREESEVVRFEIRKVQNVDDVNALPLAFESAHKTLLKFLEEKND